eukprot:5477593-Prorocentrum_lima.AAC.1
MLSPAVEAAARGAAFAGTPKHVGAAVASAIRAAMGVLEDEAIEQRLKVVACLLYTSPSPRDSTSS